jgi:hypothetical protein
LANVNANSSDRRRTRPPGCGIPEIDTLCHRGISAGRERDRVAHQGRIDGRGGNTNSFCAWYSFKMSFCNGPPETSAPDTGLLRPGATNIAKITAGGRVDRHRRRDRRQIDPGVQILHVRQRVDRHPTRPTSPSAISSSESIPNNVGMSNAVDNPSPPARMISLNRQFVSSAVPNPANIRIVHNFDRYIDAYGPRVYGN